MANISDNYNIVGSSGDNFNCDDIGGWGKGGNANDPTTEDTCVEGDYSIGLTTSDKDESWWYHDISDGSRFKITENDLGFWFFYLKGKSDNYLTQDNTAIIIRLYFGGTEKYADYCLTEYGDLSLKFGWQMLMCSGTSLNGGSVGGGHDGDSDFYLDVYRIELRLNAANTIDNALMMDAYFFGNTVTLSDGDETSPLTAIDLHDYANTTRANFPTGVFNLNDNLFVANATILIDSGFTKLANIYVLHDQMSSEVPHDMIISGGKLMFGDIDDYGNTMKGCVVVKPAMFTSNLIVSEDGELNIYASKVMRYDSVDFSSTSKVKNTEFNMCDTLKANSEDVLIEDSIIHSNSTASSSHSIEINSDCVIENVSIYKCKEGMLVNVDFECSNVYLSDNYDYDLVVLDGKAISLVDSSFSSMKRIE